MAEKSKDSALAERFVISRTFDAPRERVWQAFTEADRFAQWWGPKGMTMMVSKMDLRPGGVCHYRLSGANGFERWGKFVYREIEMPERIVFVSSFADENENLARHPMSASWPIETLSTMTFAESGGKTTITLEGSPIGATAEEAETFHAGRESMNKGFGGTWDQLDAYLAAEK